MSLSASHSGAGHKRVTRVFDALWANPESRAAFTLMQIKTAGPWTGCDFLLLWIPGSRLRRAPE